MTRRNDYRTAELVDLVLLTRDAFGETGAFTYMSMAGVDPAYFARFLERDPTSVRERRLCGYSTNPDERRRLPREE